MVTRRGTRSPARAGGDEREAPLDVPGLAAYLARLAENNDKAWFEANRAEYEAHRAAFTGFMGRVIADVGTFDDEVGWVDPKASLFRLHRDVRFSRDKRPYKTNFAAFVKPGGRRNVGPGYYVEVSEQGVLMAAGGVYLPLPEQLRRIREHVVEHPERLEAVLAGRAFRKAFGGFDEEFVLTRPPRGFPADAPLMEHLKRKSFTASREADATAMDAEAMFAYVAASFRAMHPLVVWLREATG